VAFSCLVTTKKHLIYLLLNHRVSLEKYKKLDIQKINETIETLQKALIFKLVLCLKVKRQNQTALWLL